MAVRADDVAAKRAPRLAYRRILVPLADSASAEEAVVIGCRLAAEHHAVVTALAVVEVPVQLPLSAHMFAEEARAKGALSRAAAVGDLYGVTVTQRIVRARAAGEAIVEEARRARAEVVVLAVHRRRLPRRLLGRTADTVLKHAPCRVMIDASPARG